MNGNWIQFGSIFLWMKDKLYKRWLWLMVVWINDSLDQLVKIDGNYVAVLNNKW